MKFKMTFANVYNIKITLYNLKKFAKLLKFLKMGGNFLRVRVGGCKMIMYFKGGVL